MEILQAVNLSKKYGNKNNEFYALKDINLSVNKGEFVMITGKSGSGKSTLMHILSGLDNPTDGSVIIYGQNIGKLSENDLTIFRRKNIGFIYQFYNLIEQLNVYENIVLPLKLDGKKIYENKIDDLLKMLDLHNQKDKYPSELSGGQMQRVAIGRALVIRPKILFADEPTGNLDSVNAYKIMKLLKYYNRRYKQTIIMVTHDNSLSKMGTRKVVIKDGKVFTNGRKKVHYKK
ncbi:MAG: ABC transporter ATP-binding protein [Bacilli bacterium]|nr:ABC transporter ATP-binding protein [Bacilli bacterium]